MLATAISSFLPLRLNRGRCISPHLLQRKLQRRTQHAEAVLHAAAEIDGRRLFEILGRARNLADAKSEVHALRQHLVVEDEVGRIFQQRQRRSTPCG